jgi:tRNA pseudouridine55 synthase
MSFHPFARFHTMAQARTPRRRVDGVLLLDKPTGVTSNAALQIAKRLYRAEKAGHTGTLDPLASGLLPLCFGEATKFAQRLLDAPKAYEATIRFGVTTTTGDAEGEALQSRAVDMTRQELDEVLRRFTGEQEQLPPMHSALKFEGRAYYEHARAGREIPRSPRRIRVDALELIEWSSPDAVVAIRCSKGTYVRVLAEDIGEALGCGAHLAALRRTATGGFSIADAVTVDALEAMRPAARDAALLPASSLVAGMPQLAIGVDEARRFRQGQGVRATGAATGECAVFAGGDFLGVADVADGFAHPRRVMALPAPPSC